MVTMSTERTIELPAGRPLTRADLNLFPEDGRRYELIDGTLIVSPSPRPRHQRAAGNLYLLLRAVAPPGHEVFLAPLDVILADDTVLIPDLTVNQVDATADDGIHGAPLIAIEILSPSTRAFDLHIKKARFAQAGCRHYWIVDPDPEHPSMTCWTLTDDTYTETAHATDDQTLTIDDPFALTVVPADLIAPPA